MEIIVNGAKKTYTGPLTITGLLQTLGINPESVVVERNLEIVPRPQMEQQTIEEEDSIEIIRLVGGG